MIIQIVISDLQIFLLELRFNAVCPLIIPSILAYPANPDLSLRVLNVRFSIKNNKIYTNLWRKD